MTAQKKGGQEIDQVMFTKWQSRCLHGGRSESLRQEKFRGGTKIPLLQTLNQADMKILLVLKNFRKVVLG